MKRIDYLHAIAILNSAYVTLHETSDYNDDIMLSINHLHERFPFVPVIRLTHEMSMNVWIDIIEGCMTPLVDCLED